MGILDSLMGNSSIVEMATGKLRSFFTDDKVSAILIEHDPDYKDPPLPGFRITKYMEPVAVMSARSVAEAEEIRVKYPYALSAEENQEYETLKLNRHVDFAD